MSVRYFSVLSISALLLLLTCCHSFHGLGEEAKQTGISVEHRTDNAVFTTK
mgnify:FL=1